MLPTGGKRAREAVRLDDEPALGGIPRTVAKSGTAAPPPVAAFNLDSVFGTSGSKITTSDLLGALPTRSAGARSRRVVGGLFKQPAAVAATPASTTTDASSVVTSGTTSTDVAAGPSKEAIASKNKYLESLLKNDPALAVLTPFEQEKRLDESYVRTLTNFNRIVGSGMGRVVGKKMYEAPGSNAAEKADGLALTNTYGSLLLTMFGSGVAEIDPIDLQFLTMPKYDAPLIDTSAMATQLGKMHHPVAAIHGSVLERELANPDLYGPAPIRLAMTPAERKKEKHAKRLEKREEHQKKVQAGEVEEKQKLTAKHLMTVLKDQFQENAVKVENKISEEKEERINDHLKANHDAHMAALPHQIEKRERDLWVDVEKDPSLCIFRVFPIREEMTLHTFAKFANDHKMRGFILWIANRDAIIVMAGGAAPMRHISNWVTGRMQWRETANTKASLVYSTRLVHLDRLSFHEVGASSTDVKAIVEEESVFDKKQQRTYVKTVDTVAAAFKFMSETMPSAGPWPSLQHVWDIAMGDMPV